MGVADVSEDALYEGRDPGLRYAVVLGLPMDREEMQHAPQPRAAAEVMRTYRRLAKVAIELAERIRALGWPARAYGNPNSTDILLIPLAVRAGLGELGKHGSMIGVEHGSNFRLAAVLTDLPLALDAPVDIGVDDVCARLPALRGRLPAARDLRREAARARRAEVVRRLRQVHPVLREDVRLRDLHRGLSLERAGTGPGVVRAAPHPTEAPRRRGIARMSNGRFRRALGLSGPHCDPLLSPGPLRVPESTYRETVSAFYTGLAAMQTSQEVLAREKLDRVTSLVPEEPAGWANVGLLLLRQQEIEPAVEKLTRAAALAPRSAEVQRLLALARSRQGKLPEAVAHWKRALDLDAADAKAAFALAQDTERQGGPESEAEAQAVLAGLVARTENLAVRLDYARLCAKRGDGAALEGAIAPLAEASRSWPPEAREQLEALQAAAANPRAAAPRVAFLKNVLLREPAYRRALRAVSTPRDEVGEPLVRFLALENPPPQPAAARQEAVVRGRSHAARVSGSLRSDGLPGSTAKGVPVLVAADVAAWSWDRRLPKQAFPAAPPPPLPALDGVVAADLDYDFRTDLVLAGAGGAPPVAAGRERRVSPTSRSEGAARRRSSTSASTAPGRPTWTRTATSTSCRSPGRSSRRPAE